MNRGVSHHYIEGRQLHARTRDQKLTQVYPFSRLFQLNSWSSTTQAIDRHCQDINNEKQCRIMMHMFMYVLQAREVMSLREVSADMAQATQVIR